jgi:hypothetical protein
MNAMIKVIIFLVVTNAIAQDEFCRYFNNVRMITDDGEMIHNKSMEEYLIRNQKGIIKELSLKDKGDTVTLVDVYYTSSHINNSDVKHVDKYMFLRLNKMTYKPISKLSKDFFGKDVLHFFKLYDVELNIEKFKSLAFDYEDSKLNKFSLVVKNDNGKLYVKKSVQYKNEENEEGEFVKLKPYTQQQFLNTLKNSGIQYMDRSLNWIRCSHCNTNYNLIVNFEDYNYKLTDYQISPFYLRCFEKYLLSFFKFYEE